MIDTPTQNSKLKTQNSSITGVVIARDEAKHIVACLDSLRLLTDDLLVVLDDRTMDDTARLAEVAGARVVMSRFVNFSAQRNRAIAAAAGDWVLFLDADERLTPELAAEIREHLQRDSEVAGYWLARRNYMFGKWVRHAGWYPDYQLRLLRREGTHYDEGREVHEEAILRGPSIHLQEPMLHYNYETWAQFRAKQRYYTAFEARILYQQGQRAKLRNFILQPLREFRRRYVSLKGWRDGWLGLKLSLAMAWYEFRKYVMLRGMGKLASTNLPARAIAHHHHQCYNKRNVWQRLVRRCGVVMKRRRLLVAVAMLAVITLLVGPAYPMRVQAQGERLVLAMYYQWYESGDWDAGRLSALPLNTYSSDDRTTTERQVREAHDAGINAFVSSWSGPDGRIDTNFATLLDVAEQRGDFKAAAYFETGQNMLVRRENIVNNLGYVRDHYMGRSSYLRVGGKPVLFFWAQQSGGSVAEWRAIRQAADPSGSQMWIAEGDKTAIGWLDVFDGLHDYGAAKWVNPPDAAHFAAWNSGMMNLVTAYNTQHGTSKVWAAGVQPGYDDHKIRGGNPIRGRQDGAYYVASFEGAIQANPDWVLIVSYNEWLEGSQIEPGQGYGNAYLDLTRQEAAKFTGSTPPAPPPPQPNPSPSSGDCKGAGSRFFGESGFCVSGAFLSYWYANGGLAQFGYPITAQRDEANKTDGKTYPTQWFERGRFEWHPEYGNGGAVVLGFLGVDDAQARGHKLYEAPFAAAASKGGTYFGETGHNLGGGFAGYWQAHGGLAMFGYPISEEFLEDLGGKQYIVQYFQRARFELHPELPPAFIITLGQLGRELQN